MNSGQIPPPNPMDLFNQACALREQGELVQAAQAFQQAAHIFRLLDQVSPQSLLPDIARSLACLAEVTAEIGDIGRAREISAIAIDGLLPVFERDPVGQMALLQGIAGSYVRFCDQLGVDPDRALEKRMGAVFARM